MDLIVDLLLSLLGSTRPEAEASADFHQVLYKSELLGLSDDTLNKETQEII